LAAVPRIFTVALLPFQEDLSLFQRLVNQGRRKVLIICRCMSPLQSLTASREISAVLGLIPMLRHPPTMPVIELKNIGDASDGNALSNNRSCAAQEARS
jgi:hypothetical protein